MDLLCIMRIQNLLILCDENCNTNITLIIARLREVEMEEEYKIRHAKGKPKKKVLLLMAGLLRGGGGERAAH